MTVEHVSPVASALADAVADFGRRAVVDPARVRGLLSDALGSDARVHRAEIDVLVVAVEEGVASDLVARQRGESTVDDGELLARLAARGFDTAVSTFALGAWGASLGSSTSVPNPLAATELPGTNPVQLALTQAPPAAAPGALGMASGLTLPPPENVTVDLTTVDLAGGELAAKVAPASEPDVPADTSDAPPEPEVVPWPAPPETTAVAPHRRRVLIVVAVVVVILLAAGTTWAVAKLGNNGGATPKPSARSTTGADPHAGDDAATAEAADLAKQVGAQVVIAQSATNAAKAAMSRAKADADVASAAAKAARRAKSNHSPANAKRANARAQEAAASAGRNETAATAAKKAADAALASAEALAAKTTAAAGTVAAAAVSVTASGQALTLARTAADQAATYLSATTGYRQRAAASAAAAKKAKNATHSRHVSSPPAQTPPTGGPSPSPTTTGPPIPDQP
jgi:hypothetical protein